MDTTAGTTATPQHENFLQKAEDKLESAEKKTLTLMEAIGRDCLKGLAVVQSYLPEAGALATAIFPASAAGVASATNVITLIEGAVATVEAKWAAGNESSKTGALKLADVLALAESTVTTLLTQLGIHADTDYITKLINIVVAIFNVRTTDVSAPAA